MILQRTASDMGAPMRLARFIAVAARRAGRCIAIVEPRLVPLFHRSFPGVTIEPLRGRSTLDLAQVDHAASFESLAAHLVDGWDDIQAALVPLRPDPGLVETFRRRYREATDGPIVGLSWGSKNSRKEVPDFAAWSRLVANFPATFVSLQYGEISGALRRIGAGAQDKLLHDDSVDQLADMDRFAAQVASLDAVMTVSNTGAHLAGAMSVPSVMLREDRVAAFYPLDRDDSGWYATTAIIRKEHRPWQDALDEAARRLSEKLAAR